MTYDPYRGITLTFIRGCIEDVLGEEFRKLHARILTTFPIPSRERSLALTNLEQAWQWVKTTNAIACEAASPSETMGDPPIRTPISVVTLPK